MWPVNGHRYALVVSAGPIPWADAKAGAISAGGHLATVTSEAENDFIYSLIASRDDAWSDNDDGPWLGGVQAPGSPEPDGGWGWVTGEPFDYVNWAGGEPSNSNGTTDESCLNYYASDTSRGSTWNDYNESGLAPRSSAPNSMVKAYVVEWE